MNAHLAELVAAGLLTASACSSDDRDLISTISLEVDGEMLVYERYTDDHFQRGFATISSDEHYPGVRVYASHLTTDDSLIDSITLQFPEEATGAWSCADATSLTVPLLDFNSGDGAYVARPTSVNVGASCQIDVTGYGGPGGRVVGTFSGVVVFQDGSGLDPDDTISITAGVFDVEHYGD